MVCLPNQNSLPNNTSEQGEKQQDGEQNPYPISSTKFTNPGIKDQIRTLYETLEEFYHISHRIRNPE